MNTQLLKDVFTDLPLQREDILARIARSLQLDETRRKQMEDAYRAVTTFLSEDETYFKKLDIDLYAQGSVAIGTTVRPIKGDEFDLDIVLHIKKPYTLFRPQDIYTELLSKLKGNGTYSKMVEPKRRCVRLNYAGQFHMDILSGCMVIETDLNNIYVADRELKDWTISNPKGYVQWFLQRANTAQAPLLENYYRNLMELKAEIQDLPQDPSYKKKPLQTAVQVIKRYRDIYFQDNDEHATSSIVLTTLAALNYNGENTVYSTIENILQKIRFQTNTANELRQRFKVLNPVNPKEDFTDKWTSETYNQFFSFCNDFYSKWANLKKPFSDSAFVYENLFGESSYKGAIKEQVEKLGKYSSDGTARIGAMILGGSHKTDRQGYINEQRGVKNEKHRDFGAK
jgi:hypothetical protein